MTQQMKRLTDRVDGVTATVRPASILPAPLSALAPVAETQSSVKAAGTAQARARRAARSDAWVPIARVPRAIATAAFVEPSDMHSELLAAGLL